MSSLELKVYDIFKSKLGEQEAAVIIEYFEEKAEKKFIEKRDILATKEDLYKMKVDIMWSIYIVGLIQFLSIVGCVLAVVKWVK